jgi:hypothetical protein
MEKLPGFKFGFIDNAIVAFFALLGIELEKSFEGFGMYGALYGALIGHTISDMVAGYGDFGLNVAINMGLGCFSVIIVVTLYLYLLTLF